MIEGLGVKAMEREATLFKLLSDATRLRLVVLLNGHGETCVSLLARALAMPEYAISRHLGKLRDAGLVEARLQGRWMFNRLRESQSRMEASLRECFRNWLGSHPAAKADCARLGPAVSERAPGKQP